MKYIIRFLVGIIMKIEILYPAYAVKKMVHVTSTGSNSIDANPPNGEHITPEFLAYAEKYITQNGFKLLNVDQEKLYIYKE